MKPTTDKQGSQNTDTFETGCCPRFNPEPWQEKQVEFSDKLFLKDHVRSLFHIPLNFGKVMERDMELIEKANAQADEFVMTDENSLWGADVLIGVDKEIPGAEMERISGTFLSKVFDGPFSKMSSFTKEMEGYVGSKDKKSDQRYFGYPYCPKCAKAYGNNYIVILDKV